MLVRCLYASRSAGPLTASVLDAILEQSRRNNASLGVTGVLCAAEDVFIQALEGGRDEVCDLYNAIARDQRHNQVRLLSYEEIDERRFGAWTMGQVHVGRNPALILKYYPRPRLDPFVASGRATLALLLELAATAAFVKRGD